jgi:hypothetical protein
LNYNGDLENIQGKRTLKEYPKPREPSSPPFVPENIDGYFLQAYKAVDDDSYDASAMMSRKVLEVAVKTIDPSGTGKLYKRIEKLEEKGLITKEMKDWAHIVRDEGNDAVHEEAPFSEEQARELLSFVEMFLYYTFSMPAMVEKKRNRRE